MVSPIWLCLAWLSGTAVSSESSFTIAARTLFANPTTCFTRATAWLERRSTKTSPHRRDDGMQRVHNHGGRLLMQQNSATVRDEWPEFDMDGELKDELRDEYLAAFGDELNTDEKSEGDPQQQDPHPLRMQDWKLEMRLSPWKRREQAVTFHRNGTVWTSDGDTGDWWFDVGGLYWDVNTTVRAEPTVFHHKAELHWNVFGSQPRMFRGTVTRDRLPKSLLPPWLFRPVISSFVGSGIGNDTADMSYRHRQMSGSGETGGAPARPTPVTDRY